MIRIVPKLQIDQEVLDLLTQRIGTPEHLNDNGACRNWGNPNLDAKLSVVFLVVEGVEAPIGIVFADGPPEATGVAWWLDIRFRGRGLGSKMVDAFANFLKCKGVHGIRSITIDTFAGKYHEQSSSLARRLRGHFH